MRPKRVMATEQSAIEISQTTPERPPALAEEIRNALVVGSGQSHIL